MGGSEDVMLSISYVEINCKAAMSNGKARGTGCANAWSNVA